MAKCIFSNGVILTPRYCLRDFFHGTRAGLKQASDALEISNRSNFFLCDFRTLLQWLKNPDLRLNKFITRRGNHILMLSSETEWRFCPSKLNAADVGSRPDLVRKAEARVCG